MGGRRRRKQATRITEGTPYTLQGAPSWSPDGTRFVFGAGATPMLRDNRRDIYLADLRSKQIEKISPNFGNDAAPRWSPDGATIAWVSEPNTTPPFPDGTAVSVVKQQRLMLYDVNAKSLKDVSRRTFEAEAGNPLWTNEGTRVMFMRGDRAYNDAFAYDVTSGTLHALEPEAHAQRHQSARTAGPSSSRWMRPMPRRRCT